MSQVVTVTGASGWLGRSTLEVLIEAGHPLDQIIALGSYERKISLSSGVQVQIYPISKPPRHITETQTLVHLAYLTREKVESVGFEKYIVGNLELTSVALNWLRQFDIESFITVSSGARNDQVTGLPETNLKTNPYGFLKRIDELMFSDECASKDVTCVISRLWGGSGYDMQEPNKYALGNFITTALQSQTIQINSGHKVVRRYTDTRDYMKVLLGLAKNRISANFDSGGSEIEIGELAKLIDFELGGNVQVTRNSEVTRKDDLYFPKGNEFENFASKLGIELSPISTQIRNTIAGIKAQQGF